MKQDGLNVVDLNKHSKTDRDFARLEEQVQQLRDRLDLLSDQLEFFQILLDAIPTPIFFEDLDHKITLCNMAFETVIQAIREDVLGNSLEEILKDSGLAKALCGPEITPENALEPMSCERDVSFADGSTRHVEIRHVVYFNLNGEPAGTVGMIIDLTDQKRAEQAEIEADRLRTAQKLAISVAHEFNNPLMIIAGVHQILKPVMKSTLDEKLQEHSDRIPKAVDRMHNLVQKLMKLTSLKEAEYAAGQVFYDLNASAEEQPASDEDE